MTTHVHLEGVSLDYPVYNQSSRKLSREIIRLATGGQLDRHEQRRVTVRALSDITARLEVGDRVGLIGHNGSGKSTLLKLLAGIYRPTAGRLSREGVVGSLLDISLGMSPDATGRENIYLRGVLQGLSRSEITRLVPGIVEFSGLGDFIELPMRTYSSGMLLRLAFSISTVLSPDILLMDEWLAVGDAEFQVKAEERLHEVVSRTSILVIASHSATLIKSQCNRVIYLEHGRLVADGKPDDVLPQYFTEHQ
ncbi:MAG: ABC transporter ATP-binding protein [Microbacteriaceae bacterium]|nr:ABC transporter ATP-binding protein [Microbacteriaceae bacterium]